jgi:hypothetical protein
MSGDVSSFMIALWIFCAIAIAVTWSFWWDMAAYVLWNLAYLALGLVVSAAIIAPIWGLVILVRWAL